MRHVIVIHIDRRAVPLNGMRMPVTGVQLGGGYIRAVFAAITENSKTVQSVADQRGMSRSVIRHAIGERVVVIRAATFGMPLAIVL